MRKILIVHNPTAGDREYTKQSLFEKVKRDGREVIYVSTEDDHWQDAIYKGEDLIVLTGGDGTVRKLASLLLSEIDGKPPVPIYLLPQGTANNIAATLDISPPRDFIFDAVEQNIIQFDHGKIDGLQEQDFFIEGIGYGIFPELIKAMKTAHNVPGETSEEKLKRTYRTLKILAENLQPQMVEIEADGILYNGKYLMAEILNTKYVGPKLELASQADPGDGYFDLVLLEESKRGLLYKKIDALMNGTPAKEEAKFSSLKVKKVKMRSSWPLLHVDDIPINNDKNITVTVEVVENTFRFM